MAGFTPEQHSILELERLRWRYPAAKDAAIRDQLGISPTIYYQRLGVLLDDPAALEVDPVLVRRLQRLRAARREQRAAARLGQ